MNLLKNFRMKTVAVCILSSFASKKELFAKSVLVRNIIGFNLSGSGNALIVVLEPPYEVEPLWSQQSCHFTSGIYAWPG